MIKRLNGLADYLSPNSWFKWYISFALDIPVAFNEKLHKKKWNRDSQSPAVEVFHIREKHGYFASNYSNLFSSLYISFKRSSY